VPVGSIIRWDHPTWTRVVDKVLNTRSRVARVRIVPNTEAFDPVIVPLVRGDVTGGPLTVHFEGRVGNKYALDGSDNLATWTGVVTNTAVASEAQLTDPVPPAGRRFYRIRQVP
jgi:hypothetical protein